MKTLILLTALLTGCGFEGEPLSDADKNKLEKWTKVVVVTLPDGTPCAVVDGTYKAGIDCNWRKE
jgi:hypothetical protein